MRACPLLAAAFGLALLVPATVLATEGGRPVCLADGRSYEPGSVACISGPDEGKRLARCDLHDDDGGSYVRWTVLGDSCPLARAPLDPLERLLRHAGAPFTPTPAGFRP